MGWTDLTSFYWCGNQGTKDEDIAQPKMRRAEAKVSDSKAPAFQRGGEMHKVWDEQLRGPPG